MRAAGFKPHGEPQLLIIPGLGGSGPQHWQTLWEAEREDCSRVDLGMWDRPQPAIWADRLGAAISAATGPIVLVAHSLGCHAVAWWNAMDRSEPGKVRGALLVAPPEVEDAPVDSRLAPFAPVVRKRMPFPSILVASQNDTYAAYGRAKRMARAWGSRLIDAGPLGHINVESGVGDWPYGRFLLRRLVAYATPSVRPLVAGGAVETLRRAGESL